jgi:hypothetical protein
MDTASFETRLLLDGMHIGQRCRKLSAAASKVEITVTYVLTGVELRHSVRWRHRRAVTVLLAGGRALNVTEDVPGIGTARNGSALGSSGQIVKADGFKGTRSVRIVAGVIFITDDFATHISAMTIKTGGKSLCSATDAIRLKPGNEFFQNGGGYFNSDEHAEDINCSIRAIEN